MPAPQIDWEKGSYIAIVAGAEIKGADETYAPIVVMSAPMTVIPYPVASPVVIYVAH
jgi:hypothetical protein